MSAADRAGLTDAATAVLNEAATDDAVKTAIEAATEAAIEAVRTASGEGRLATLAEVLQVLAAGGHFAQPEGRAAADDAGATQAGEPSAKAQKAAPAGHGDMQEESPLADPASCQTDSPADSPADSPPGVLQGVLPGILADRLASHPDLAAFESLSGQTVYHAPDLLSHTYARILDRKGSPLTLLAEEIRANSRDYPRPVPVELFEAPPFDLSPEEIERALHALAADPANQDITFTTTSTGMVYLFSTRHLERGYASFLAQRAESLSMNP